MSPRLPEQREVADLIRAFRELADVIRSNMDLLRVASAAGDRPRSRKLVGWKALVEVSVANGGPGSENRLRDLCRKRGAPVHVWRGMAAVADEQRFIVWLEGLRVPIALEPVGGGGKSWKGGKKSPKKRVPAT